jgi:carboxymethylenebutenolidase
MFARAAFAALRIVSRDRAVLLLAGLFIVAPPARADGEGPRLTSYVSGGKPIKVEHFLPKIKGKHAALLLLHGSDGLAKRGDDYRAAARDIAAQGYAVLLVHYFDRTGTTDADKETINEHFFSWIRTIHDGVAFAARLPNVDPARIGLIGYSLGGYLSLSAAALAWKEEHKVAVIVEYFGGLPKLLMWGARRLPATLILHGEKDDLVPVKEARDLENALKEAKVPCEIKIYPDQGHGFSQEIAREARELGFKFLERHLAPKNPQREDKRE